MATTEKKKKRKARKGRPPVVREKLKRQKEKIMRMLLSQKLTKLEMAEKLGVRRDILTRYVNSEPKLRRLYKDYVRIVRPHVRKTLDLSLLDATSRLLARPWKKQVPQQTDH